MERRTPALPVPPKATHGEPTHFGNQLQYVEGELFLEGVSLGELANRFGTPLHVVSRAQLTDNYRRACSALSAHWPGKSVLHFSVKANPSLAIGRLFATLGAGGDCTGLNELRATLASGTMACRINLNGNNKEPEALDLAVREGARINVDDLSEFQVISAAADRHRRRARVALRLKPALPEFADRVSELRPLKIADYVQMNKWGLDLPAAERAITLARADPAIKLEGLHYHLGRQLGTPEQFELLIPGVVRFASTLRDRTGWAPASVNLGGGLTQGRDPFGAQARNRASIGERQGPDISLYAKSISRTLQDGLVQADMPLPVLELESGRYLTSNAGVSLATVGVIKEIGARVWVNVDLGTHQIGMMRLLKMLTPYSQ